MTDGRGADSTIDAVGMEAHGAPFGKLAQTVAGLLPDFVAEPMVKKAGVDRLAAPSTPHRQRPPRRHRLDQRCLRRHGRPDADDAALRQGQLQLRMGQAHVKRWIPEILPLLDEDAGDPLGTEDLASHKIPIDEAPRAYEIFQKKQDGATKIILQPNGASAA